MEIQKYRISKTVLKEENISQTKIGKLKCLAMPEVAGKWNDGILLPH